MASYKCYIHPDKEAIAFCNKCAFSSCAECIATGDHNSHMINGLEHGKEYLVYWYEKNARATREFLEKVTDSFAELDRFSKIVEHASLEQVIFFFTFLLFWCGLYFCICLLFVFVFVLINK